MAATATDNVTSFIEAVKSALPSGATYLNDAQKQAVADALEAKLRGQTFDTLNMRNINGAAGAFAKGAAKAFETSGGVAVDPSQLADYALDGLTARADHKALMTNGGFGGVDKAVKDGFKTTLDGKHDIVKGMESSYDQLGKNFGGQAIRYGTAAVGTFLVYNRLKALFKKKEVVNEQTGEVEQKNPSFWSRLGNLLLATGIGIVTYKVGFQNKTFGQVGEDISNKWQQYVTNRANKAPAIGLTT